MAITKKTTRKTTAPASRKPGIGYSPWIMVAKISLAFAAFLIPLAAGTWTADRWEIHKTVVLMAAVTVAWFCYFVSQFRRPSTAWIWHPLDWMVIILGLGAIVGTIASVDWWTSLTGLQGQYSETLPAVIGFISIYILSARLYRTSADRLIVWSALLGGLGLSLILQLFQISGVSFFGGSIGTDELFSTLGNSPLQVALLASVVATTGLLLWAKAKEMWARMCLAALVTLAWFIVLFMGQTIGWAAFAVGMIVVVIGQAKKTTSTRLVVVAVALAAAGMLGQFMHITNYTGLPSTDETTLNQATSTTTAFSAVADRPVLGTGPSTWYNAFVQYRPLSYNSDPNWGSRFLRSGAQWSEVLATTGVVGLTTWIGLLAIAGWEFWRRLNRGYSFTVLAGLFVVALLAVSATFTTWSFSLMTVGWFALGLGRAKLAESDRAVAGQPSAMPAVGFALVVILAIVAWYPAVRVYASQVLVARAQQQLLEKDGTLTGIRTLERAVQFDRHNLDASMLLANAYGVKIQEDLQANDVPTAQNDLALATSTIHTAVKNNAKNPVAYEAENNILNGLANYLPNPEEQANANFATLRRLEPTNPIHDVGFGQTIQVIRARAAATTQTVTSPEKLSDYLQQALAAFNEALRKKPDYLQARYARADANLTAGEYQASLDDLDALTAASPSIATFWTAKGTVLAKLNKLELATTAFEQAITLDDNDPNAYLAYSQALSDAKKTTEAKAILNRGLKTLSGNADLTAALTKLNTAAKK